MSIEQQSQDDKEEDEFEKCPVTHEALAKHQLEVAYELIPGDVDGAAHAVEQVQDELDALRDARGDES